MLLNRVIIRRVNCEKDGELLVVFFHEKHHGNGNLCLGHRRIGSTYDCEQSNQALPMHEDELNYNSTRKMGYMNQAETKYNLCSEQEASMNLAAILDP